MNPFEKEYFSNLPEEEVEEVYRNGRIRLPFDPKDLVMFLDRGSVGDSPSLAKRLRVLPYHHRSADLGVVYPMHESIVRGNDVKAENVYLQIDIKGVGFLHPEGHESKKDNLDKGSLTGSPEAVFAPNSQETPMGFDVLGLMDEGMAMTTIARSRELAAEGMRTEAIAGVYRLKTIRLEGRDLSVKEFKQRAKEQLRGLAKEAKSEGDEESYQEYRRKFDVLNSPEGYNPVALVRLVRSVFRLRDLKDATQEERLEMLDEVERCLNIESSELGRDENFDLKTADGRRQWLVRLAGWVGEGIGVMHGKGLVHMFLHMGNISLAGEIVDLDSVQPVVKRGKGSGRSHAQEPFFRDSGDGYAYIDPAVGAHRLPDERFGLPKCLIKDMRDASFSFRMVLKEVWGNLGPVNIELRDGIVQAFLQGYSKKIADAEPYKDLGISRERLTKAFAEILDEVIRKGKRMPPIPTDV